MVVTGQHLYQWGKVQAKGQITNLDTTTTAAATTTIGRPTTAAAAAAAAAATTATSFKFRSRGGKPLG